MSDSSTRTARKSSAGRAQQVVLIEPVEGRVLMSASGLAASHLIARSAAHIHIKPQLTVQAASNSTRYGGYGLTPAIIRTAYEFSTTGNEGAGQTIAIVDAYDDPNIAKDLANFDQNFGIAGTNANNPSTDSQSVLRFLTKVNETGGTTLPAGNASWAQEISLDVEWAHAVAPAANILLVEASSNSNTDLLKAAQFAATRASVVSMSWGGAEFSGENGYDSTFAVPGVSFIASTGDTGGIKEWPAESPNVLAVGGTTLSNSNGVYVSESAWSGSGGGTSGFEAKPAYQSNLTFANRSGPDVAFDANPNSGFAVYDSYRYQSQAGWLVIGGTSAGTPQWAGLIATADQQRAAYVDAGGVSAPKAPLNSIADPSNPNYAQSVQAALYGLFNSGVAYSGSYFHDVTAGTAGSNTAAAGYDQVTGIGSPFAQNLIGDLANNVA